MRLTMAVVASLAFAASVQAAAPPARAVDARDAKTIARTLDFWLSLAPTPQADPARVTIGRPDRTTAAHMLAVLGKRLRRDDLELEERQYPVKGRIVAVGRITTDGFAHDLIGRDCSVTGRFLCD